MKKDHLFQIRLTNKMDEGITQLAEVKGMTKSDYVRYIIQIHMDNLMNPDNTNSIKQVVV